jgi:hypothetical protein
MNRRTCCADRPDGTPNRQTRTRPGIDPRAHRLPAHIVTWFRRDTRHARYTRPSRIDTSNQVLIFRNSSRRPRRAARPSQRTRAFSVALGQQHLRSVPARSPSRRAGRAADEHRTAGQSRSSDQHAPHQCRARRARHLLAGCRCAATVDPPRLSLSYGQPHPPTSTPSAPTRSSQHTPRPLPPDPSNSQKARGVTTRPCRSIETNP